MDDLIPWLRAQIDRDAQSAQALPHAIGHVESRWSPARLLAQCEAYTRILDEVVPRINEQDDRIEREWGSYDEGPHDESELLIKLVASAYRHHPGYREEWRP